MLAELPVVDMKGRVLGVDVGTRRVGLAISDPIGIIASPHSVLRFTSEGALLEAICVACRKHDVTMVVVGQPINIDGTPTKIGVLAESTVRALQQKGISACTWDEQFSSREAGRILGRNYARVNRFNPGRIDQMAAAIVLQDYLEHQA